ncbi:glycosyltransferase family 2 protein [Oceaniferula flava]|nr:glycosyltransferase family 2 protein [Oceaniferula flavus]
MIPSYNTGPLLEVTVRKALAVWDDVFVIIDGSTDGSADGLEELSNASGKNLRIHRLPENRGKGAAVLAGVNLALDEGFTHALAMDADGQHPADYVEKFMAVGEQYPDALVLGQPVFDASAPALRVNGRKVSNWWANFVTLWWGINDSLFGMRLYPLQPLKNAFASTLFARRFDFDPEVVIRMCWRGTPLLNLPTPVKYISAEDGGVSQFKYFRDNTLLTWMYIRLVIGAILRLPMLIMRAVKGGNPLKGTTLKP